MMNIHNNIIGHHLKLIYAYVVFGVPQGFPDQPFISIYIDVIGVLSNGK